MAQLKDILEKENNRGGNLSDIYLFVEGMFYRAYERSAWLSCRYVNEFKATRRDMKNGGESVVFIGFPVASLSKFVPQGVAVEQGEGSAVLHLPLENHPELSDTAAAEEAFANWKNSVPMAATAKKGSLRSELKNMPDAEPRRMSEIMLSIMAFPVEQKTPMECMMFVTDLKQNIAKLM